MRITANALNADTDTSPRVERTYMAGESVYASVHGIQTWDIGCHTGGMLRTEATDTARTVSPHTGSILVRIGDLSLYFAGLDALRALADYATAAADAAEEVLDR